ncbi:ATP-binding protein [Dethiobacter alkaliphilus]|uniref:histidine kinase n=1 Tax=Dethiobacter alkaliphilus AHT 1 TaxID=555088 RepID=C0GCQ8_DETAL|nr:ATP-binding protein [Dethiobacter alkaliphilus]EEG78993.1 integral membrane sensor signal transduction histidine kinase [Dethiobacter alkaliphilus AHT 1]
MYLPRRNSLGWRYFWVLSTVIAVLVIINFIWSTLSFRESEYNRVREKASIITEQFIATRSFIAKNQDRINNDSQGNFEFKHLNPAAVGRGVGDLLAERTDYAIKQVRVNPRNPQNEPDAFEREALERFSQDSSLEEIYQEADMDGQSVFRYIVPLYIEESCLDCHGGEAGTIDVAGFASEGLQEGDLGGAISVVVPTDLTQAALGSFRNRLFVFSAILLVVTLSVIMFVTSRLVARPLQELTNRVLEVGKGNLNADFGDIHAYGEVATLSREFSDMVAKIKDLYDNMERKVKSRTRELEAANLRLTEGKKSLAVLNQKLSENSRLKSEFMATMTHELRTPLTSIVAFCELLLDEIPGPINEEQQENLMDIKTSAQQLMLLINDILDMAKFEAGHLRLDKENVDLNDVFRAVRRTMSSIAYQNGVRLDVSAVDLPLVYGDPERLRQMLSNLIANAVKHSKEGGYVHIYAKADNEFAAISVEDNGDGIPPELMPHIFEKFRQGEDSLKRRRNGTGLGLALVKTLAELQDGNISVNSEVGEGTTFTIHIPFAKQEGGLNDE